MRQIFEYLKEYQRKHFDLKLYLLISLFLTICFVFNYTYDFEDSVIDSYRGTFLHWLYMFLWMMFPFLGVSLLIARVKQIPVFTGSFWLMLVIGFAILALDRSFIGHLQIIKGLRPIDYRFAARCLNWSSSIFLNVLPLMLVYAIFESERPRNYYGLALKRFDPKPYFLLLAGAMVFIGIGSFFSDIQSYYPRFQYSGGDNFAEAHGIPVWMSVLLYEITYGSDFVSVEVFFRGFLIHAFVKTLGGYAVLPMVASYAFLHFGKPLTEAISSVFGGYILGIISYNSKNVWGGIIIHMGVAWTMELFGYLQSFI